MNLLALIAMMVLTHITFTGSRVALTLFAIQLGATPFMVGFLMSMIAVLPMLLSIHAGRWTDRIGVTRPTQIALVMLISGSLLPALHPTLNSLYIAGAIVGPGFMLAHVAINNAVGHATTPQNRTHAFSMLALGFSISSILGPMIAGFSIDLAGHVVTFIGLGAFSLIAFAVLRTLPASAPAKPPAGLPSGKSSVLDLFRHVPLRAVFIVSALMSMGWDLFTFMVPVQGARIGLSASTIGLIMGAFGIGTFAVRLALPAIARRFSSWQILTGALTLTGIIYLLFPLFTAVPVLLTLAFVLGLGLGSAQPTIMGLIHQTAPAGRTGEAVGVRSTLINMSQTALPLMFGALGSALGMVPVFWALAAALFAGGMFAGRRRGADN